MAMDLGQRNGDVVTDMNTTPLIDVMLVLLTLLIVTLPLQTHAVKIDLPHGPSPVFRPVVDTIAVDFDGTILWNGMPVDRATLDAYLMTAAHEDPQPEIHVQPNRLAKYDAVAMVLADAQRIGVTKIGFPDTGTYGQ